MTRKNIFERLDAMCRPSDMAQCERDFLVHLHRLADIDLELNPDAGLDVELRFGKSWPDAIRGEVAMHFLKGNLMRCCSTHDGEEYHIKWDATNFDQISCIHLRGITGLLKNRRDREYNAYCTMSGSGKLSRIAEYFSKFRAITKAIDDAAALLKNG